MASTQLHVPPETKRRCLDLGLAAAAVTGTTTPTDDGSPMEDVLFEILSWLPAKYLRGCRCVSKSWRALISNRAFAAAHGTRAEPLFVSFNNSRLQLMDAEGNVVRVVAAPIPVSTFCLSFEGVVVVVYLNAGHKSSSIWVTDLAPTGKTDLINWRQYTPGRKEWSGVAVSSWMDRCFGFGHAAKSGTHKIFGVILQSAITGIYDCEVLTIEEASKWRRTRPPPHSISAVYDDYSEAVTFNGRVHFLSLDEDNVLVLCFDLEREEWEVIQGPAAVLSHAEMEKISIAELNGSLCIVQHQTRDNMVCLWLLTDHNSWETRSWVKAYSIPMGYRSVHLLMPLRMMHPTGRLLFSYFYDKETPKQELQIYDPSSRRCADVKNAPTNLIGKIRHCSSHVDPRFCIGPLI